MSFLSRPGRKPADAGSTAGQALVRRNETGLLGQGVLFLFALTFIDGNAVVSVFIDAMGGSLALAGLVSAIHMVPSILAQLFVGIQVGRIRNLPRYITIMMAVFYGLPAVASAVLFLGAGGTAALAVFLVLYGLMWAGDGCILIGWYDLLGRLVEPRRRGLLMGRQQLFGGILAFLGSFAVNRILSAEELAVPIRFAVLFGIAGLLLGGSAAFMAPVRDAPHRQAAQDNPLKHIASFPKLFRANALFRCITAVQALQGVAVAALPILILFSKQTFSFTMEQTALLIPAQVAGSVAGGLLWGVVSHRFGNRRVIQLNQANILLFMALAVTEALTGASWLAYPLAFFCGITMGAWMGIPGYIIDIAGEAKRPLFLVMSSLVGLPFTFLPPLAGKVAESFGFLPVFLVCIAAAAGSLTLSVGLKEKPDGA